MHLRFDLRDVYYLPAGKAARIYEITVSYIKPLSPSRSKKPSLGMILTHKV